MISQDRLKRIIFEPFLSTRKLVFEIQHVLPNSEKSAFSDTECVFLDVALLVEVLNTKSLLGPRHLNNEAGDWSEV